MAKRVDAMIASFAVYHAQGMKPRDAALLAGYAETTVNSSLARIEQRARDVGLLVDPAVLQDAVAILEQALPDIARRVAAVAKGEAEPSHDDQLDWIREAFDRARGRARQQVDVTTAGQSIIPTVFRPATATDAPDEDA